MMYACRHDLLHDDEALSAGHRRSWVGRLSLPIETLHHPTRSNVDGSQAKLHDEGVAPPCETEAQSLCYHRAMLAHVAQIIACPMCSSSDPPEDGSGHELGRLRPRPAPPLARRRRLERSPCCATRTWTTRRRVDERRPPRLGIARVLCLYLLEGLRSGILHRLSS